MHRLRRLKVPVQWVLACVLSAFSVTACISGEFDEWTIRNDTSETVYIVKLDDGDEVQVGKVLPDLQIHLQVNSADDCSRGILVARTASGREVDRRTEPLCRDDMWVVRDSLT